MKRLNLSDFKTKNNNAAQADQLLGQVLGNCHDGNNSGGQSGGSGNNGDSGGPMNAVLWSNPYE